MDRTLAHIDPSAKIGENVEIGPFSVIAGDVEIGDGTWIGPHVVIDNGARIGRDCRIFAGAVISTIPQDLKFQGEYTTAEIGDRTVIREYATINRGTSYSHRTVVGSDTLIMAYAHIAHDCIVGHNAIVANAVNMGGHVEIGNWAIIGGMCAIHQFTRVGDHAILAGGAKIMKDIPPFVKVAGVYPVTYGGVNSIGLKRRGFTKEQIHLIQDIYRIIYQSGMNNTQALEVLENDFPQSKEGNEIIEFIRATKRGLMRGNGGTLDHDED
ncbi:MAG: acyl-ACP--UDP-N-acetylglucosamine O-acyltransferase [Bacteroidia bacterium]|nr:acyl-ACP--UDP-N-acetylglucosamine O-acyltransferase [Bacteroidia bacterium]